MKRTVLSLILSLGFAFASFAQQAFVLKFDLISYQIQELKKNSYWGNPSGGGKSKGQSLVVLSAENVIYVKKGNATLNTFDFNPQQVKKTVDPAGGRKWTIPTVERRSGQRMTLQIETWADGKTVLAMEFPSMRYPYEATFIANESQNF